MFLVSLCLRRRGTAQPRLETFETCVSIPPQVAAIGSCALNSESGQEDAPQQPGQIPPPRRKQLVRAGLVVTGRRQSFASLPCLPRLQAIEVFGAMPLSLASRCKLPARVCRCD